MVKTYSLWIEKTGKGKYKFRQRYVDPLRSTSDHIITRTVSVTLTKKTAQARREAEAILGKKIQKRLADGSKGSNISLLELTNRYQKWLKDTDRPWNTRKRAVGNFKFINQHFPNVIAKNITTPMINNYLEWCLYERPRKLSNSSVRLRKVFLSNAFRYGIDHGLVTNNPVTGVRVKWRDESQKERERTENKYLTDHELRALLGYVKYVADRPDYYYLFKFMYLTGMRISEAAGLKKDDFFKKGEVWYANVTGKQEYHYGKMYHDEEEGTNRSHKSSRTKTRAGYRKVQLNQSATKIYMLNRDFHPNSDYIFCNLKFHTPWNIYTVDRYLKEVGRLLGISKRLTSHFFRHTYISKQAEKGTPLNVIMNQVGQKDSSITKEIYTHVTERERLQLQNNLEKMDADIGI